MEFLDPDKKKRHGRRLFIGYFLLGVAIVLAALILFFQSYGYDVDHKTGKVIQNGLIFADAHPESATVYLNGQNKGKTDTRLTIPAGSYTMELRRDGYRTWKRSFNLEGSSIEQLVYPVLFPAKLTPKDVSLYSATPAFTTQSADRHWLLVQKPGSLTSFDEFDANNPNAAPTALNLPADLFVADPGEHTLQLIEWASDNRHVLVKHGYADKSEFVVIDRDTPASSLNINRLLAIEPSQVTLRDKKFDQLYVFDAKAQTLKTADTKSKLITAQLTGVTTYKSYAGETLLYSAIDPANPDKVIVKIRDGSKDYVLRSYATGTEFLLNITRFDNHWYAIVAPKADGRVSIYRDPMTHAKDNSTALPTPYTVLLMQNPQQTVFSANTRFILAQSGNHFAVYDAETNRRYYYDLPFSLTADQKATWMDGHRLLVNQDGKVVVFDFDGINQQTLVPIVAKGVPYFDKDFTRLYTLAPSVQVPSKPALTQTPLKFGLQ